MFRARECNACQSQNLHNGISYGCSIFIVELLAGYSLGLHATLEGASHYEDPGCTFMQAFNFQIHVQVYCLILAMSNICDCGGLLFRFDDVVIRCR